MPWTASLGHSKSLHRPLGLTISPLFWIVFGHSISQVQGDSEGPRPYPIVGIWKCLEMLFQTVLVKRSRRDIGVRQPRRLPKNGSLPCPPNALQELPQSGRLRVPLKAGWMTTVRDLRLCAERALLRAKNRLALGRRRHASSLIHSAGAQKRRAGHHLNLKEYERMG